MLAPLVYIPGEVNDRNVLTFQRQPPVAVWARHFPFQTVCCNVLLAKSRTNLYLTSFNTVPVDDVCTHYTTGHVL